MNITSKLRNIFLQFDEKLEAHEKVTENTSITGELEDDDTLAQSCLELHSDAHRFNDISEHYSDKELNKTELVCNSKSKKNSGSVTSNNTCDQNEELSKNNEQNKTKTESSILNEDLCTAGGSEAALAAAPSRPFGEGDHPGVATASAALGSAGAANRQLG